jgi:hypothetical protein
MKIPIAAALWACALLAGPASAAAQAHCSLREVEGSKAPGGVGPGLEDVKAMLAAPPFGDYKSYRLVATHPLELKKGAAEKVTFSHKHRYEVTFMERLTEREGRGRLRLRFDVFKPDGAPELKTIVVLDENGAPFPRVEQHGDRLTLALLNCRS